MGNHVLSLRALSDKGAGLGLCGTALFVLYWGFVIHRNGRSGHCGDSAFNYCSAGATSGNSRPSN
jgi:hypothetical protein